MNIFYLDKSPVKAAQYQCDKHVVKMILETAQLLSTSHRLLDGTLQVIDNKKRYVLPNEKDSVLYKATHINHPSAIWARHSIETYHWLKQHFVSLCLEYTYRYGKLHKSGLLIPHLSSHPNNMLKTDWIDPPLAMPDEFKIDYDPIESYRLYYRVGKAPLHKWTNRDKPEWL